MSSNDLIVICLSKGEASSLRSQIISNNFAGCSEGPAVGHGVIFRLASELTSWCDQQDIPTLPLTDTWKELPWKEITPAKVESPVTIFEGSSEEEYKFLWEINLGLAGWYEDIKIEQHRLNDLLKQIDKSRSKYIKAIGILKDV